MTTVLLSWQFLYDKFSHEELLYQMPERDPRIIEMVCNADYCSQPEARDLRSMFYVESRNV